MKAYQPIVGEIAQRVRPRTILDMPSASGWLLAQLDSTDRSRRH